MGEATSCALCLSATVSSAVGWAMQIPMCSCDIPWLGWLEAVFINEWSYKLFSCPGTIEVGLRSRKLSVVLTQACLTPSSLAKQVHWLCSPNYWLTCSYLSSSIAGMHGFQMFSGQMGIGVTIRGGAVSQQPCLGGMGKGHPRQLSILQTCFPVRRTRELPTFLASINPHSYAWHRNCPSPEQALLWRWSALPAGIHSFQRFSPALLLRCVQKAFSTVGGAVCDSVSCWGTGKPVSKAGKTPHLRIWIKNICIPLSFLVRVCHQLGFADE